MTELDSIGKDDVVELDPRAEVEKPFKGPVKQKRSEEVIIKPDQHSLDSDVLAINMGQDMDQFTVLIRENGKNTRVFSVSSVKVYDKDDNVVYSDSLAQGDIVYDENSPNWSDDNRVEITEVTNETSSEYVVDGSDTVADFNPDYPSDDTVVKGKYVDGGDKEYSFPISRLSTEDPQQE